MLHQQITVNSTGWCVTDQRASQARFWRYRSRRGRTRNLDTLPNYKPHVLQGMSIFVRHFHHGN